MGFYSNLIENVINKKRSKFNNIKFIGYLLNKYPHTFELVHSIAEIINLKKPQRCFIDHDLYYVAHDLYTQRLYLCFKTVLMIDIDYKSGDFSNIEDIRNFLSEQCHQLNLVGWFFQSANGAHLFLIDKHRDFRSRESINLMLKLRSDPMYTIFSHIRGWSVRLSRKEEERELSKTIYEDMGIIGNQKLINRELVKLVKLHIRYSSNTKRFING